MKRDRLCSTLIAIFYLEFIFHDFFLKWAIPGLFFVISDFSIISTLMYNRNCEWLDSNPGFSGIKSGRSVNYATTTDLAFVRIVYV